MTHESINVSFDLNLYAARQYTVGTIVVWAMTQYFSISLNSLYRVRQSQLG